jgi:alpha-L-fucosidase
LGYNPADINFKLPRELIHTLCEVVGKSGNLLLNITPMGDGKIQPELIGCLAPNWLFLNANVRKVKM